MKKKSQLLMLALGTLILSAGSMVAQTANEKLEGKWEAIPEGKDIKFEMRRSLRSGNENYTLTEKLNRTDLEGFTNMG